MNTIKLNEKQLRALIKESVEDAMIEEGWLDNMKAGFKGFGQGYKAQQSLDADNSNRKRHLDREDLANNANPFTPNAENTASMEANKLYQQFQEYRKIANQLLAKRNELIKQYGLIVDKETKMCSDPTKNDAFKDSGIGGRVRRGAQTIKDKNNKNTKGLTNF